MVLSDSSRVGLMGTLSLGLVLALSSRSAAAASHLDVGVGLGFSAPPACVEGHYETRVERVLVSPEHWERRWVDATYEARHFRGRSEVVLIRSGYWSDVFVPARFEERTVRVWVPHGRPPVVTGGFLGLGFGKTFR